MLLSLPWVRNFKWYWEGIRLGERGEAKDTIILFAQISVASLWLLYGFMVTAVSVICVHSTCEGQVRLYGILACWYSHGEQKNGTEWSLQYSISFCKGDEILVTVSAVLKCQYKQKSVLVFRLAAVQSCILVLTNCHVISWQDESLLLRNKAETTGGKKKTLKKPNKTIKTKTF